MSNHRSHLDIPSVFEAFDRPLRAVGKSELSKVPIWGPAMRKIGMVFVTRGDTQRAIRELEDAKARLREGISVFIAPEGTRSRDGQLKPFKKGGFHLAKDLGAPILPVWVEGTAEVMKPDSFRIYKHGHVKVRIGPAIEVENDGVDVLAQKTRDAMLKLAGN
jgi:1-acyl-sn-glycerol-3-phosphate acyltransferase